MKTLVKSKRRSISVYSFSAISVFFVNIQLLSSQTLFSQSTEDLVAKGNAFHNQFDTYNAFKTYHAAYESDSTCFEAIWKMAGELIDMGNELPKSDDQMLKYNEAVNIAARAVQLNPNNAKGHLMLASALEKTALDKSGADRIKILNQSRAAAEKALQINADEDMGYNLLGRWNLEMANTGWLTKVFTKIFVTTSPPASYENALDCFQKAIRINQNSISHYIELGKTYVFLEKWTEAGEVFNKVIDLPGNEKSDSKWQREARHYLQLLQQGNHSELTDSIEE
jgi:tetratricopeptide (TPR) repeat protein